MRKKLFVTIKGASIKSNSWKPGQVIFVGETLAEDFIRRGIATEEKPETSEEIKEPKKKKS